MINIYRDPIFDIMDVFFNRPFENKTLKNNGLRDVISRPHNVVTVKADDATVTAQRLERVTTPLQKDDAHVTILNNVLSVSCGSENIADAENEDMLYHGISSQSYTFALKLANTVDQKKSTAENKDGILKINLPFIKKVEEEPKEIQINID